MIVQTRSRLSRGTQASVILLGLLAIAAIAAPIVAPYSPVAQPDIIGLKSTPPSLAHPFGTDMSSRDVLSRVIYGARLSLSIAAMSVLVMLLLGTTFGAVSALAGGWVDRVMMRVLDVALSIPRMLVLLAVTAFWAPLPHLAMILVIGCTGWYDVARMVRGEVHSLMRRDFVLAAQAGGVRRRRLLARHLLPHLLPVLAVSATIGVANVIGLETALSYLGLGVRSDTPSWGSIMQEGRSVVDTQWWLTLFPALATILAVLACNALGDALRDIFTTEQVHG